MRVVIIGAGVNGLYLARKLSEKGNEVTVFEKKGKIGKKACSGLFSEKILEYFPQSQKLIQNKIESVYIHFPRRTIQVNFGAKFFVMSHFELDNLAADAALASGVKIILNRTIDSLSEVMGQSGRVIGCDGPYSIIRRDLGLPDPSYRLAIQGFLSKEDFSNSVEAWPVDKGFIWKIPRGEEIEYGIIADYKKAKGLFETFLQNNKIDPLIKMESALVPQARISKFLTLRQDFFIPRHSSATLCGDAAGLTKPWSGGGVIWGLLAADILLKSFPDFFQYQKAMRNFFLPKILTSKIATNLAYFCGNKTPWLLPKKIKIEGDFLR